MQCRFRQRIFKSELKFKHLPNWKHIFKWPPIRPIPVNMLQPTHSAAKTTTIKQTLLKRERTTCVSLKGRNAVHRSIHTAADKLFFYYQSNFFFTLSVYITSFYLFAIGNNFFFGWPMLQWMLSTKNNSNLQIVVSIPRRSIHPTKVGRSFELWFRCGILHLLWFLTHQDFASV